MPSPVRAALLSLLLLLAVFSPPLHASEARFLSDFDDTLQIAGITESPWERLRRLYAREAFAGVPEFLRSFGPGSTGGPAWDLVSAKPTALRAFAETFFGRYGLPLPRMTLRDNPLEPTFAYKARAFRALFESAAWDAVLFGDDGELDPEVYAHLGELFPDRIRAVYIRSVRARDLPPGHERVFTTFDVAFLEHRAGRLSAEAAERVGEAVLAAPADLLWPSFAACTEDRDIWREILWRPSGEEPFQSLQALIVSRIRALCAERNGI